MFEISASNEHFDRAKAYWLPEVLQINVSRARLAEWLGVDSKLFGDPESFATGDGIGLCSGLHQRACELNRLQSAGRMSDEQRQLATQVVLCFTQGYPDSISVAAIRFPNQTIPEYPNYREVVARILAEIAVTEILKRTPRVVGGLEDALVQAAVDFILSGP